MSVVHLYRAGDESRAGVLEKLRLLKAVSVLVGSLDTEVCFNIELSAPLDEHARQKLHWLLAHPFHPEQLAAQPHLVAQPGRSLVIEIGPRYVCMHDLSPVLVCFGPLIGFISSTSILCVAIDYLVNVGPQVGNTPKPTKQLEIYLSFFELKSLFV